MKAVRAGGLWFSEGTYEPGEAMPEHAHPEACVTLLLRGCIEERAGRRNVTAEPASIGIKPFHLEHADRFGPAGTRTLKLKMGATFVDRLEEFGQSLARWRWVPLGGAVSVMLRMRSRLATTDSGDAVDWLEDHAIELLAALQEDDRLGDHPAAPPWLRAIRREVVGNFRRGVRTRVLAEQAGVHPVYLARSFRRAYGESISECVRRLRVREAARRLHEPGTSGSDIAFGAGFADQSHLSRTFRRETGVSPSDWQTL